MIKYLSIFILMYGISCQAQESIIEDNVSIKIYPYEDNNEMKASAMPEIKRESELIKYKKRFDYLLMNVSEIHFPEKFEERNEIFQLYPDTLKLQELYLQKYTKDKRLAARFEETWAPIANPNLERNKTYTVDELMEVASKFFYCDKVQPDTSIQAHVCIGLNGVKEANWEKDYTLLEAFCYEGIFTGFDNDDSQIWDSFVSKKKESSEQFKMNISTLNQYLEEVKLDLFKRMKNDEILKKELLDYYELNKNNLAFRIIN